MIREEKREAVEFALNRRVPSETASKRIAESFQQAADLFTQCRACGHERTGTFEAVTGPCPACGHGVSKLEAKL